MDMQLMKNENEALMRRKLVPVAMGFGLFFLILVGGGGRRPTESGRRDG